MCILKDTKRTAADGRGGTHAIRAEQAVKTGVVKIVETPVGPVSLDRQGKLQIGSNRPANI